jgi:flagellar biosynthesis protein
MERKRKAVALAYAGGSSVPAVVARARGMLAERLIEIAEKHHVTVYRDGDLAEMLSVLDPGVEIPETLFRAVAEVLAYCYRVNDEFRKKLDESEA